VTIIKAGTVVTSQNSIPLADGVVPKFTALAALILSKPINLPESPKLCYYRQSRKDSKVNGDISWN
jgi:hypothetical protein